MYDFDYLEQIIFLVITYFVVSAFANNFIRIISKRLCPGTSKFLSDFGIIWDFKINGIQE